VTPEPIVIAAEDHATPAALQVVLVSSRTVNVIVGVPVVPNRRNALTLSDLPAPTGCRS
jgi:hypothetical protein